MTISSAIFGRAPPPLPEPAWDEVMANSDERRAAAGYWRDITTMLGARRTIDPANGPAILRLVVAYLVADRASAEVLRNAGERVWSVYREASQLASAIESDLGLSPLSRDRIARR